MSNGSDGDSSTRESLSALADGELEPSRVAAACAAWRDDARSRATWHAYHVIGDVLRSEDLASLPARDAAFVSALQARLAAEPTVLAPEPRVESPATAPPGRVARGRSGWPWKAPSAVAAGFVMVAGALVMTRTPAPTAPAGVIAAAPAVQAVAAGPALPPVIAPTLAPAQAPFAPRASNGGKLLRDARLDHYLAAHQQFAGSSALGVPSGFLRNAAAEAPNR